MTDSTNRDESLREAALRYHEADPPGKIALQPTKPLTTQGDLALAYSPGVAAACEAIVADPQAARRYTARGNLVAVITNGTAVLGLGAIGPLAAKPVMEGKAVLFKKFAGIDAIDLCIEETDPKRLIEVIAALEPSFGAINLEDIKAPECFEVESALKQRMRIPVFHDDQHGTAIIVGAAVLNWARLTGRDLASVHVVASGAGAAALACLELLVELGIDRQKVLVSDRHGVVHVGRAVEMDDRKAQFARETGLRTLAEAMPGADLFLGLSVGGIVSPDMVAEMADRPLIMALANPNPEITPDAVRTVRADAFTATGRSDYANQVNNVLCFPFIFRGALDVGATAINEPMKIAAVHAIADLALKEGTDVVADAYGEEVPGFGPEFLIPKPFDPRLITEIAPAVARAAMDSGVAERPIADLEAYRDQLSRFVFKTGMVMKPVFERAANAGVRIVFCEGEEERVLRAVQNVVDDRLARPTLIGRPEVVRQRIERLALRLAPGRDFEIVNPEDDPRYRPYWQAYHRLMARRGITPADARTRLRTRSTVIGAMLIHMGEAEAMICGTIGRYRTHLEHVIDVLGLKPGVRKPAALSALVLSSGTLFVTDPYVTPEPTTDDLVETTLLAADEVRRFGVTPRVALLSHSNFGTHDDAEARRMRDAVKQLHARAPELELEGEMHADAALSPDIRANIFPDSALRGQANLLVMPSQSAANIAVNMLKVLGDGIAIGPLLLGCARPAHILTPTVTVRGIVNAAAIAAVEVIHARPMSET